MAEIKDLNLRPETIKVLEENVGEMLQNVGIGKDFLDKTPEAQAIKAKTDIFTRRKGFFLQYPETMACSSDLIGVEEKCFCCSNDTRDWIASNRFCSSWGSEYAHIDTQKDMEFLKMCTGTAMHWVGLSRRLGEPWKWTNCTTLNDG
ncbi:C-type lectin domain family 2 member A-like [Oryctolagus cuniculus]|uniref:C-type lectin domain family 2 member A-like n=1 Tax=Oryctolagus cuniculus TaxID=9986 RepID=UPI00387A1DF8